MNTQTSNTGFMPRSVAITLLTSKHSKTNGFRKRCLRATECIAEPVLAVSAPKTYGQRLVLKLRRRNARQLHQWATRVQRRANNLQDALFAAEQQFSPSDACGAQIQLLKDAIEQLDTLGQAIKTELDRRARAGVGYKQHKKKNTTL